MDFFTWLIVILLILLFSGIKVINEYQRAVVFRLGRLVGVRGPGLIFVMPIFERMVRVGLRTITMNIPSQKIITKDNVSIDIAAVAYYHVVDAQKSVVAIEECARRREPDQPDDGAQCCRPVYARPIFVADRRYQ